MQVSWGGYSFTVYEMEGDWNDVPGVYIFAGRDSTGQWWQAKYIGRTHSFRERMKSHERWAAARKSGATSVHAMVMHDAAKRVTVERELIEAFEPTLNRL